MSLVADIDAKAVIDLSTATWITPYKVLGGNVGVSMTVPLGWQDISAGVSFNTPLGPPITHTASDNRTEIGDLLFGGLIGWHEGNFHWNLAALVNTPTGNWEDRIANLSFNRWALDTSASGTWLDPKLGIDLSGSVGATFNGDNPITDYNTGTEFHLELAATRMFSNGLSIGVMGYHYQELTGDSGEGARLGAFKGRVSAIGPVIGYSFKCDNTDVTTRLKWLHEFDAENRLEGNATLLTVAFPIGGAPSMK